MLTSLVLDGNYFNNISLVNNVIIEQVDMQHNQIRDIDLSTNILENY